LNNKNKLRLPF